MRRIAPWAATAALAAGVGCRSTAYVPPAGLTPSTAATVSGVPIIDGRSVDTPAFADPPAVLVSPGPHRLAFQLHRRALIETGGASPDFSVACTLRPATRYEFANDSAPFGPGRIRIRDAVTGRTSFMNEDTLVFYDEAGHPLPAGATPFDPPDAAPAPIAP